MPLGRDVGLSPSDIVLDGTHLSSPGREQSPPIFGPCLLCQTAGWIKMLLGMEVGIGPGYFVLDMDPAPPARVVQQPPSFRPMSIVDTVAHLSYC